jgi:hypothetical protein
MKSNENWGTKEAMHFLSQSNEALRTENRRLLDEIERLTNSMEVLDAEIVSNQYYGCKVNYNFNTKTK